MFAESRFEESLARELIYHAQRGRFRLSAWFFREPPKREVHEVEPCSFRNFRASLPVRKGLPPNRNQGMLGRSTGRQQERRRTTTHMSRPEEPGDLSPTAQAKLGKAAMAPSTFQNTFQRSERRRAQM